MNIDHNDYYQQQSKYHRRLGPILTIDGQDAFDTYDADLYSEPVVVTPEIEKDIFQKVGKHSFWINTVKRGIGGLQFEFIVGGETKDVAQNNYAKLVYAFDKGIAVVQWHDPTEDDPSAFEYVCTLSHFDVEYTGVWNLYQVSIEVVAIKRTTLVRNIASSTEIANQEVGVYNTGNVRSGMRIIAKTGTVQDNDQLSFHVGDQDTFHVSSLESNTYYVIDGIDGKVLKGVQAPVYSQDGTTFGDQYINHFNNTDLIEFPVAQPYESTITFNGPIESIVCEYYPVYLM